MWIVDRLNVTRLLRSMSIFAMLPVVANGFSPQIAEARTDCKNRFMYCATGSACNEVKGSGCQGEGSASCTGSVVCGMLTSCVPGDAVWCMVAF